MKILDKIQQVYRWVIRYCNTQCVRCYLHVWDALRARDRKLYYSVKKKGKKKKKTTPEDQKRTRRSHSTWRHYLHHLLLLLLLLVVYLMQQPLLLLHPFLFARHTYSVSFPLLTIYVYFCLNVCKLINQKFYHFFFFFFRFIFVLFFFSFLSDHYCSAC